jgi:hypothetical protein
MGKLTWYFERSRWTALLAFVTLGCVTAHPDPKPPLPDIRPPTLSQDCLDWAHAQELLADLALKTMQTYGRIDPGFYRRNADGAFGKDAEAPAVPSVAPEPFDAALALVNGLGPARDGLARGLTAAESVCGETACPATAYSITVEPVDTHIPGDFLFSWEVNGKAPEAVQWRAFLLTYASAPPLCPVPESIAVRSRLSGLAQTSGLFNHPAAAPEGHAKRSAKLEAGHDEEASFGCYCPILGTFQKNGSPCGRCPGYYFSAQPCNDR